MEIEASFQSGLGSDWEVPGSFFIPISAVPEDLQSLVLQTLNSEGELGFLLNSHPITSSLEDQLNKQQISTEAKIVIEFYFKVPPLESQSSSQAEDWVSCVKVFNGQIFSVDYAGTGIRHGDEKVGKNLTKGPLKALDVSELGVVSVGLKGEVFLTGFDFEIEALGNCERLEQVVWNVSSSAFALGSCTGNLLIGEFQGQELSKGLKKQKLSTGGISFQTLPCPHTDKVTGLCWPSLETLISCSWDHSITFTDLEKQSVESSVLCTRAVQCMKVEKNLILAGFENGVINGYDSRSKGKVVSFVFGEWVRAVGVVGNAVVAGGEGGDLKVFDMRAGEAVRSVDGAHEGKVLTIDCWGREVVSGGSDGKVNRYNFIE